MQDEAAAEARAAELLLFRAAVGAVVTEARVATAATTTSTNNMPATTRHQNRCIKSSSHPDKVTTYLFT